MKGRCMGMAPRPLQMIIVVGVARARRGLRRRRARLYVASPCLELPDGPVALLHGGEGALFVVLGASLRGALELFDLGLHPLRLPVQPLGEVRRGQLARRERRDVGLPVEVRHRAAVRAGVGQHGLHPRDDGVRGALPRRCRAGAGACCGGTRRRGCAGPRPARPTRPPRGIRRSACSPGPSSRTASAAAWTATEAREAARPGASRPPRRAPLPAGLGVEGLEGPGRAGACEQEGLVHDGGDAHRGADGDRRGPRALRQRAVAGVELGLQTLEQPRPALVASAQAGGRPCGRRA